MPVTTVVHLTHLNVQEWMENSCRYPQFIKTHISYYKINISTGRYCDNSIYIYCLSTKLHQKISWVSVLLQVHSTSNNANGNKYIVSSITSHVSYVWTSNEIGSLCNKIIFTIMTWKKNKKTSQHWAQVYRMQIFFGIPVGLYYGDNYILSAICTAAMHNYGWWCMRTVVVRDEEHL